MTSIRTHCIAGLTLGSLFLIGGATAAPSKTLRQAAGDRMLIGAAVMASQIKEPALAKLVAEQFNCLTPENEMKPDALQKVKGTFTFEQADKIVAFAEAHDMQVIGHNLCWHNQSPAWMYADEHKLPLTREIALKNLHDHIHGVVSHYKGKVKGWDVVNEALADSDTFLRNSPALKAIGDDFIVQAFTFAHEADPQAELYYNDYNIEEAYKFPKAMKLIKDLKAAGVKLDGIGIQGHWLLSSMKLDETEKVIQAFQAEGLKVMITELDIDPLPRKKGSGADITATEREGLDPYKEGMPADVQEKLAKAYGDTFAMLKKNNVTRITIWGTHDGTSWLNSYPVKGRVNHPLLFDRTLQPKPAFEAVIKALE